MFQRLQQWLKLPAHERGTLLALMGLQPAISLGLHMRGYRRTLCWLERYSRHPGPHLATTQEFAAAQRTAELSAIAGRHGPLATTCLRQALATYWMLRRRGLLAQIRLGVDRIDTTPDMHAWVELGGELLAQPDMRHAAFSANTASRQADTAATTSGNRA